MSINFTLGIIDTASGKMIRPLPDFESLDLSPVFCQAGTVRFKYPQNGVNFSYLGGDVEIAVYMDGVEITSLRSILESSQGSDADEAEDSALLEFTGRNLLSLLDKAVVYPKNWPNPNPPAQDYASSTPGGILINLLTKAQARGALSMITWDFTSGVDSNGVGWTTVTDTLDISFDAGITYTEVVNMMVDRGLLEVAMRGRVLKAYVVGGMGTDRTIGSSPLRFTKGRDISDSPRKMDHRNRATSVLLGGAENSFAERTLPPTNIWGRRETYHSINNTNNPTSLSYISTWVLQETSRYLMEVSHGLVFQEAENPRPITHFDIGDWGFSSVGKGWERYRIKQWVISVDNEGMVTGSVILNDLFAEFNEKLARMFSNLAGGVISPGSSEEKDNGKSPAVPTGLSLGTDYYLEGDQARAAITLDWDPVTHYSDSTLMNNLAGYRVRWRYQDETQYRGMATTGADETAWLFAGILPGKTVLASVQAFNRFNRSSAWSANASVTTAGDTVAPLKPAPPVVVSRVGTLRMTWSGLDFAGNEQPADFAGVEIHVGPNGSFTPTPATLKDFTRNRSFTSVTLTDGLTYGQEYWVRLVAVDTSGNKSPASDETSTSHAVLSPVVSLEIGSGQIGLNNTRFSDVGNLVDDGSFENAGVRATRQAAMAGTRFFFDNSSAASNGYWSIGCNSGTIGAVDELLLQSNLPVKPGERIFGAADFRVTSDNNLSSDLSLIVRWYNKDRVIILPGGVLPNYEVLTRTYQPVTPLPRDGQWYSRITLSNRVAPAGATSFDLFLADRTHSAGTIWVDAIEVRRQVDTMMIGTAVIQAAHIGLLQVNDAHMANVSIGKLTAGSLTADMTVSSRIKTANTGARAEMNSAGFQAWNSGGLQTFNVSGATGAVSILGELRSGSTGRRIIINPSGTIPEIQFYPTSGANYAFLNAISETSTGVAVSLTSGGYSSMGLPTVGRLYLSADPYSAIKLGQVATTNMETNGSELWLGNAGVSLQYKLNAETYARTFVSLGSGIASIGQINQTNVANSARIDFIDGIAEYSGKWANFTYPLPQFGLFTGSVLSGAATSFTVSYGPTMSSSMVPVVTCVAGNFGTATPTVWGIKSQSTTDFTVAWNNSQGMRFNFWCYRV